MIWTGSALLATAQQIVHPVFAALEGCCKCASGTLDFAYEERMLILLVSDWAWSGLFLCALEAGSGVGTPGETSVQIS